MVERNFNVGDKVLALLPIPGTLIIARYSGPYVMSKKLGQVNYVIHTPDQRKSKVFKMYPHLKFHISFYSNGLAI